MQKPFLRKKDEKIIILNNLSKIIKNSKKIGIDKIIIPLVDNSSLKNLDEENSLIFELKKLSKKFPSINFYLKVIISQKIIFIY